MSNNIPIKKKIFGGFSREQVDRYLNSLHSEYDRIIQNSNVDSIKKEICSLKDALSEKDKKIEMLKARLEQIDCEKNQNEADSDNRIVDSSADLTGLNASDSTDEFPDIQPNHFCSLFFNSTVQNDDVDFMSEDSHTIGKKFDGKFDALSAEIEKEKIQNKEIERKAAERPTNDIHPLRNQQ